MKGKVKIEVDKGNGHYFYTGTIEELEGHYKINTIKGEQLIFRKEQVVQIQMIGDDMSEKMPQNHKHAH